MPPRPMRSSYPPSKGSRGRTMEVTSLFLAGTTVRGKAIIVSLTVLVAGYTFIALFGELLFLLPLPKSEWCKNFDAKKQYTYYSLQVNEGGTSKDNEYEERLRCARMDLNSTEKMYENPDYITDPCRYERIPQLFWLTIEECDISRRMMMSVLLGGIIGYERRASDKPAGIRTMGLLSLGSCFFAISSQLAFKSSSMGWDSSRVAAAIPSGVGFLGAGLIWKGTVGIGDEEVHQVHGLTTAAGAWLSAAVGVGCGGALYFPTVYATMLVLMVLRYGPKLYLLEDSESVEDEDEDEDFTEEEEDDDDDNNYPQQNMPIPQKNHTIFEESQHPVQDLLSDEHTSDKKPTSKPTYDSFENRPTETNLFTAASSSDRLGLSPNSKQGVAFKPSVDEIDGVDGINIPLKEAAERKKKKVNKRPSFHS